MPTLKGKDRAKFFHGVEKQDVEFASKKELLQFANEVRQAGGGKALKELFPARQSNSLHCLIAEALNFECRVQGSTYRRGSHPDDESSYIWSMHLNSEELAVKIANKLNLKSYGHEIILPLKIGNAAEAFDRGHKEFEGLIIS